MKSAAIKVEKVPAHEVSVSFSFLPVDFDTSGGNRRPRPQFNDHWSKPLLPEAGNIGARRVVVEAGWHPSQLRRDGLPFSNERPKHPSVKVYVESAIGKLVFPSARWSTAEFNLAAVAKTLEAQRAIRRFGVTTFEQQFAGHRALPPGAGAEMSRREAAELISSLGESVGIEAPAADLEGSVAFARMAYRGIAKHLHPDREGGDALKMQQLNQALAVLEAAGA